MVLQLLSQSAGVRAAEDAGRAARLSTPSAEASLGASQGPSMSHVERREAADSYFGAAVPTSAQVNHRLAIVSVLFSWVLSLDLGRISFLWREFCRMAWHKGFLLSQLACEV